MTKTRWIKVFVPYDEDGSGGTTVGDSGEGVLGEYVWVQEEYETEEQVIVRYEEETYTETEQVQVGTTTEERTRAVPIYEMETYAVEVPVYEQQEVEVTTEVPVYETVTWIERKWEYQPPVLHQDKLFWIHDQEGVIYIDGRIVSLHGLVNGRVTVVGAEKVRIDADVQYVDDRGETAMLHGKDPALPYVRNPEYRNDSVLGVIARDDIVFTWNMDDRSEINATLMSVEGRVGADGIWIDDNGEPIRDSRRARNRLLTEEERTQEDLYDRSYEYATRPFVKDSLRRLGGIVSNSRILETYIRPRSDGTAYVAAGFKRGTMRYDFNMRFNPPPNFVEIPQPVLTYFAPVFLVRDRDP